jgi:hypothetical protein
MTASHHAFCLLEAPTIPILLYNQYHPRQQQTPPTALVLSKHQRSKEFCKLVGGLQFRRRNDDISSIDIFQERHAIQFCPLAHSSLTRDIDASTSEQPEAALGPNSWSTANNKQYLLATIGSFHQSLLAASSFSFMTQSDFGSLAIDRSVSNHVRGYPQLSDPIRQYCSTQRQYISSTVVFKNYVNTVGKASLSLVIQGLYNLVEALCGLTSFEFQLNVERKSGSTSAGIISAQNTYLQVNSSNGIKKITLNDLNNALKDVSICAINCELCKSQNRCSSNSACSGGYCKNGPSKTSVGCQGTCMAKLDAGGNCSKGVLNFSSVKWPASWIFLLKKPVRLIVRNF